MLLLSRWPHLGCVGPSAMDGICLACFLHYILTFELETSGFFGKLAMSNDVLLKQTYERMSNDESFFDNNTRVLVHLALHS